MDIILSDLVKNAAVNATAVFYALANLHNIWLNVLPLFLCFIRLFDVYCFTIGSKETMSVVFSNIKSALALGYDEDGRPQGLCVDPKLRYVMYRSSYDRISYLYCTKTQYKRLVNNSTFLTKTNINIVPQTEKRQEKSDLTLKLWCRKGDHSYASYKPRDVMLPNLSFNSEQLHMYSEIMRHYNEHNHHVAFIYGPIGSGKTWFSYMLARELRAGICAQFSPTSPSDTLDNLYMTVEHSPSKPIIIVLDEVDVLLGNITEGVPSHKTFRISVQNKTDWNDMIDRIKLGCYPNIILLLISNISRETISSTLDSSYLRDGRIDSCFALSKIEMSDEFVQ